MKDGRISRKLSTLSKIRGSEMIREREVGRRLAVVCLLALACLMSVKANATQKTVPIVIKVEIGANVLKGWTPAKEQQTRQKMLNEFEDTVRGYFETWWDIVSQHRMQTRLTVTLVFLKGGWKEHYFRVDLRVQEEWADGSVSKKTHILARKRWQDTVGLSTPPTTSKNVTTALPGFLQSEFPNDWVKKKAKLLKVISYAPVAVGSEWLGGRNDTLLLPFPNTSKYEPYEYAFFRLKSRHRYRRLPLLTARANGQRQEASQDPNEPLIVTVDNVPPDPNDYEHALVYLSTEDPLWDTY